MSDATDNRFYREKERHEHKYMEALRLLKEAHYLAGKSMGDAWYNAATALLSAPSAVERTFAPAELLDKCIVALSGEYVEKPDDAGEEWNAAVGYCIGKLRVMQEQLPSTPSSAREAIEEVPAELFEGHAVYVALGTNSGVSPRDVAAILDAVVRMIRARKRSKSRDERRCPYCTSDNEGIRSTYYDQTCEGCVKRMVQP